MTDREITAVGPAFAASLRRFRGGFRQDRTAAHFGTSCRGPPSDLPRKTAEPIAPAAGTAVRTLQEFLAAPRWDHDHARDTLQRHLAEVITGVPADGVGTVGWSTRRAAGRGGTRRRASGGSTWGASGRSSAGS